MNNSSTNYPTAQELVAANPMLGVLAMRIVRLWHSGQAQEAEKEYRAAISNYSENVRQPLDAVIAEMCLRD